MEPILPQPDTDIGAAWKREVDKFNAEHPECMILSKTSWSLESIDALSGDRRNAFGKWRKADPPDSKRAWLKAKLKDMTGIAIKLIDGAGALAGGAFAPAPAIAQVLTFLLAKTTDLSDHLDNIQDFFDITETLFMRLELIERRMPKETGFVRQLERVFAKILQLLSIAVSFTKRNKFKLFLKELGEGNNDAKDAWTAIQTQIGHLDSSVMYATLGAVQKNREATERIEMGVQSVDSKVRLIQKDTGDININMQNIFSAVKIIKDDVRNLAPKASSAERAGVADGILEDGGSRVLESFKHLRARLGNADVDAALDRGLAELSAEYLPGTCSWIEREEPFQKLVDDDGAEDGTVKSLLITGGARSGKSMMASYILAHLKTKPRDSTNTAVAYFRFGKDFGHQRTVEDMLNSCVVQIADKSPEYCKLALGILQKSDRATAYVKRSLGPTGAESSTTSEVLKGGLEGSMRSPDRPRPEQPVTPSNWALQEWKRISEDIAGIEGKWRTFFKDVFVGDGPEGIPNDLRLFLILDGMDDVEFFQVQALAKLLSEAMTTKGRLRLIMSASSGLVADRPDVMGDLEQCSTKINLSELKKDLKTFTAASIRTSGRLRVLRPDEQAKITEAICGNATSFLHASYLVRRINAMGLVDPDRVAKFNPIGNLIDEAVYADLLKRCAADRAPGEIAQLQCLFIWLTHCDQYGNGCMGTDAAMSIMGMVYQWPPLEDGAQMGPTLWNTTRIASHWSTERQWERRGFDFPEEFDQELVRQGFGSPERFEEEYERNLSRVLSISTLPMKHLGKGQTGKDVLSLRYSDLHRSAVIYFSTLIAPTIPPENIQSVLLFTLFSHAIVTDDNEEARRYAADHWLEALRQLEYGYESDGDKRDAGTTTAAVVDCIAQVLNNQNGALRALEDSKDVDNPGETASIFGGSNTEIDGALRMISKWVKMMVGDEGMESLMSKPAKTWFRSITSGPGPDFSVTILRETARHHMRNWLASDRPYAAYASCRFTQRAIFDEKRLSGNSAASDSPGQSIDDAVEQFIQQCDQLTAAAHNAIDMAYRYDGQHDKAILYLERAIDILEKGEDNDPNLQFTLCSRLGRVYYAKYQEIVGQKLASQDSQDTNKWPSLVTKDGEEREALVEALKHCDTAVNVKTGPSKDRARVFELKAKVEAVLGHNDACIRSIEQAVEVSQGREDFDGPFTTQHFEDLVHLLLWTNDYGTHSGEIMTLVKTLGAGQLAQTYHAETHRKIQEAAKTEDYLHKGEGKADGETCVVRLAALYDEAVGTLLENKDDYAATIAVYQADLALFVQEDKATAKAAINAAINNGLAVTDPKSLTRTTWRLADILLEQFVEARGLQGKETALMEMESLPRRIQELRPEFEAEQSQMSIPLYLMRRVLGPAHDFFSGADGTFRGCVAAVMDDVADNDIPSLQVLAKVLRLLPGLEEDAAIVASAQFYVLDYELAAETRSPIVCTNITCGRELGKTDEAWLCCFCTNTLLCGACRDQKNAKTESKPDRMWYPCHGGHPGIDMPAKQLSGIRQKRIFLTGNTEGILIVDWLKQLEGKWDAAWNEYWNQTLV